MQAWSMLGAGVEVRVRSGQLMLRTLGPIPALYRGLRLHPDDPDDPYAFLIDLSPYGMDTARVVFSRDAAEATTGVTWTGSCCPPRSDRLRGIPGGRGSQS